ncbi:hypothetical protein IVB03_27610 [Bradyrhizobium sp. 168]|uniref:hypothetical protein n=1 Tax=Bradyrhizobium sp. 168 TaxID=2782639 RepID=UPI001FF8875A|nr:hypothetical protein [Bradyrhizobium sp. 168]MCK1583226.1 hypothetical protein [Bradyrhizobium sp. 168]
MTERVQLQVMLGYAGDAYWELGGALYRQRGLYLPFFGFLALRAIEPPKDLFAGNYRQVDLTIDHQDLAIGIAELGADVLANAMECFGRNNAVDLDDQHIVRCESELRDAKLKIARCFTHAALPRLNRATAGHIARSRALPDAG